MLALWLVGAPGIGKTTALRHVFDGGFASFVPKPKWTIAPPVALAGHYTGTTFDGGDTVPYNGAEDCLLFWLTNLRTRPDLRLTVFDGDRFSSAGSLERVRSSGVRCCCVLLTVPGAVLEARRAARGAKQASSWALGRATKASRFYEKFGEADRLQINADAPPQQVAAQMAGWLNEQGCNVVLRS